MTVHLENEDDLLDEARNGSTAAFSVLLSHYGPNILRLTFNITSNRQDAEDAMQEAFLKAYLNLGQFRGESRFYTWLVSIAVNECLMVLRNRRGEHPVSLDEPVPTSDGDIMPRDIEDWGENPEQRYSRTELHEVLSQAIQTLDPIYRIVFTLRDVECFSTQETADMLQISVMAVKARLLRARLKLREQLTGCFKSPAVRERGVA